MNLVLEVSLAHLQRLTLATVNNNIYKYIVLNIAIKKHFKGFKRFFYFLFTLYSSVCIRAKLIYKKMHFFIFIILLID